MRILKKADAETESTPVYKYVREIYQAAYEQSKKHKGIACAPEYKPIKLSKQQKYILVLLAKGCKNAEIITLTGLPINMIQSHTRAIYEKLEVSSAPVNWNRPNKYVKYRHEDHLEEVSRSNTASFSLPGRSMILSVSVRHPFRPKPRSPRKTRRLKTK